MEAGYRSPRQSSTIKAAVVAILVWAENQVLVVRAAAVATGVRGVLAIRCGFTVVHPTVMVDGEDMMETLESPDPLGTQARTGTGDTLGIIPGEPSRMQNSSR